VLQELALAGRTVIVVTHNREISRIADRVIELSGGRIVRLLGTVIGLVVGSWLTRWLTTNVLGATVPDIALDTIVSPTTMATAVALGVLAVALAPVLTLGRLRHMDVPGTLRTVE
jgi:hypothetical protein